MSDFLGVSYLQMAVIHSIFELGYWNFGNWEYSTKISHLRPLFMLKKRFLVCPTTKMAFGNISAYTISHFELILIVKKVYYDDFFRASKISHVRPLFMLKKRFFLYLIIKMAFGNILLCHMSTFFRTFAFYGWTPF